MCQSCSVIGSLRLIRVMKVMFAGCSGFISEAHWRISAAS